MREWVVVAAVGLAACGGGGADGEEGGGLPAVEVATLDGASSIVLDEIDGPAVINLWATWCAPCRAEMPEFEEVHHEVADEVRFIGLNIGEDADVAAAFVDEVGVTYDQLLDDDGSVAVALGTSAMPVTIVIDADEEITLRHLGPLSSDDLRAAIDDAT